MYEYFELGVCDALKRQPHQLSKKDQQFLKTAFEYAPAYTGGVEEQKSSSGIPWGKLALLALLASGGAYAHGKMAGGSPLAGFASGVDDKIVNPLVGRFKNLTGSPEQYQNDMSARVNEAGLLGQFDGVKNLSQLHGTEYDDPSTFRKTTQLVGGAAGVGMLGGLVCPTARAAARVPYLGKGLRTVAKVPGMKLLGRAALPLAAVSTIPDSVELGDKLNDSLGIKNRMGRLAVQTGTVGAGVGSALGGARVGASIGRFFGPIGMGVGGVLGGIGGMMLPSTVNGALNYKNNRTLQMNQMNAQAGQLRNEFTNALSQKRYGNMHPINAWYGLHRSPEQLNMTVDQFKDDPAFQNLINTNNPFKQ